MSFFKKCARAFALSAAMLVATGAGAVEIAVSSYGVSPGSMPWAVALKKGYFAEEGVDITGIRSSSGGAATVRDMIAGDLPFAEAGPTGVLTANKAGADLKIVSCNANTLADVPWVTMPDSPINSLADLKGKRIGFTTAKSTTNMVAVMFLKEAGLTTDDVELVAAGGFSQAITALEAGGIDLAPMVEVDYIKRGDKYKMVARTSDVLPPMSNVVGVSSSKHIAENPKLIEGIIRARRKAVQFIYENPAEAAQIIAEIYQMAPDVVENTITSMVKSKEKSGIAYWGQGDCDIKLIDEMLNGARLVDMIQGDFDIGSMMDLSVLPEDLRNK